MVSLKTKNAVFTGASMFQGIPLNIYMLMLTITHLVEPTERINAFKKIKECAKEVIKSGKGADKQKNKVLLHELG